MSLNLKTCYISNKFCFSELSSNRVTHRTISHESPGCQWSLSPLHPLQLVFCFHCISHYLIVIYYLINKLISLFISLIVFLNWFPLGCLTHSALEYIDQFLYWNWLSSLLICSQRSPHTQSFPCWSNVDCKILGAQLTLANQEVPCLVQVGCLPSGFPPSNSAVQTWSHGTGRVSRK